MQTITTERMKEMLDGPGPVINVLDEDAFERAHIPGTTNIPVSDEDFASRVASMVADRDTPIVVYCASSECDASPRAAKALEEAGFTDVHDYEGGTAAWSRAGNELEGEKLTAVL